MSAEQGGGNRGGDIGTDLPNTDVPFADLDEKLSWVNHALRTPLASIRAFAEILIDNPGLSAADQRTMLTTILGESDRLAEAVSWVGAVMETEAPQNRASPE